MSIASSSILWHWMPASNVQRWQKNQHVPNRTSLFLPCLQSSQGVQAFDLTGHYLVQNRVSSKTLASCTVRCYRSRWNQLSKSCLPINLIYWTRPFEVPKLGGFCFFLIFGGRDYFIREWGSQNLSCVVLTHPSVTWHYHPCPKYDDTWYLVPYMSSYEPQWNEQISHWDKNIIELNYISHIKCSSWNPAQ